MPAEMTKNGVQYDPVAMGAVERSFWWGIWDAVPADVASERGIEAKAFGTVQATIVSALPEARMLNLVLGAAARDADAGDLEVTLDWVESKGVAAYVPVSESAARANQAQHLLEARGYERGYAWMKFVRDAHPPRFSTPSGVDVTLVESAEEPFGMIAATGFGLPAWASIFFADLHSQPGWHCYVARVDDEPAACAAMFIQGDIAEFGIAATLEPARGRGCQQALLHRRITDAAAVGCHTLFVETGERIPDRPSASYRNILRAGFEGAYLRPNWQRRPHFT
jgi:GNAT superfamily N-acetyltransferase